MSEKDISLQDVRFVTVNELGSIAEKIRRVPACLDSIRGENVHLETARTMVQQAIVEINGLLKRELLLKEQVPFSHSTKQARTRK